MGREIPAFAWLLFGLIVILVVGINLALIAAFLGRNRPRSEKSARIEPPPFNDLPETIRHPWHREDEMLEELSERVKRMKKPEE